MASTEKAPTASKRRTNTQLEAELARARAELADCRAERDKGLEYQTAISDVLKVIARPASDLQAVLDTVAETAARLCDADYAVISVRKGEIYRLVASSISAAEPEYWAKLRDQPIVPGRQSTHGRVMLEGKVVQIPDILVDPDYASPAAVAAGIRSQLGVPFLRDGELVGIITLNRRRVEPFTERQIERASCRERV